MAFHPVTLQPPLYRHLSFFLPPIKSPSKWKSWFTRRLHYGLKLLAQYEYILISCTFVQIFWNLACMTTSIGTAFLHSRTFNISFTAFNTGSCKTTGFFRCWAVPLLHRQDVLKEFTASQAFIILLGEKRLKEKQKKCMFSTGTTKKETPKYPTKPHQRKNVINFPRPPKGEVRFSAFARLSLKI